MPKIGIGLLTYNRPDCRDVFLNQLEAFPPHNKHKLHIEQDNPKISEGKNNCLKALSSCDYIYLFDDDCFVLKPNWDLPFIESGMPHLMFLNKSYNLINQGEVISEYANCSGCFLFLTKEAFKRVGYFNTKYQVNGLEHVGYSARIKKAYQHKGYFSLNNIETYLHSVDLQGPFPKCRVNHTSTISDMDRMKAIELNSQTLSQEINDNNLYHEYHLSD